MVHHIFCDESSQNDRYMVLGGIITPGTNVRRFNRKLADLRTNTKMGAELKWQKVTRQKLAEYKAFVDFFVTANKTHELHFSCMIFDNHLIDHRKYSAGDSEIGFYKLMYQLLLRCFGKHYCREGEEESFVVTLHRRATTYSLSDLRRILNHGMAKEYSIVTEPFRSIEPKSGPHCPLLQINDIVLGAIGFRKNGRHNMPGVRAAKVELSEYLRAELGLRDLCCNTSFGQIAFKIWNFKLRA